MKILYINPNADLYGASRSLLRLVTALDKSVFVPRVLVPSRGPLLDALVRTGIAVDVVPYLGVVQRRMLHTPRSVTFLASFLPSVFRILGIIRREGVDIVHTNTATTPTPAVAARLAGVPHVWHLREMFADDFPMFWSYFARFMLRFADRVLCVSAPIMAQFQTDPKVEVLHNGLDPMEYQVDQAEVNAWRRRLASRAETILVGVVSRISPWKGQDVFLEACAVLRGNAKDVRFVIAGDTFEGNERLVKDLTDSAIARGFAEDVVFTGFVEEPRALIAALDILVLPSTRPDPFPGVVLEGMALGVPVVATNSGGAAEQVVHGVTGYLVLPKDPASLAAAILDLLMNADLRRAMGRAGRERIASHFTLDATRRRIEAVYLDLQGRANAGTSVS